ncbi:hypothetical protein Mal4_18560 [Maioricimonas rarisocia]|uniref:Probable inorganic carbon transporter subunit DabA n=1 Tax=Maioricimonas rarisocia TaxID=2528026 RepID=A0A517Z4Y0_9PLAN|nr:DUF2309 domain-containing protein [Maioricimonas rarisocia]QDU37542.1 hypothetical protein Mal4_18560 [Maioricimonas rarisocia]
MPLAPSVLLDSAPRDQASSRLDRLRDAIHHAAHLLPTQGPITSFVHHNTLHAFEELPFEQAVDQASRIHNCEPFLRESRYREMLEGDRIRLCDLEEVLKHDLGDAATTSVCGLSTRHELRLAMLRYPLRQAPDAELRWLIAETDAISRFRDEAPEPARRRILDETRHWIMRDVRNGRSTHATDPARKRIRAALNDLLQRYNESRIERWSESTWEAFTLGALWRACHQAVHGLAACPTDQAMPLRHRTLLLEVTGNDTDTLVHDLLIRFCAAFLDQGFATWVLPDRDRGFYESFLSLYSQPGGPPDRWLRGLRTELMRLQRAGIGPLESIDESLSLLGVADEQREQYILETLLALKGWAGIIGQLEQQPAGSLQSIPPDTLREFLAVRLLLDRQALSAMARESLGFDGPLRDLSLVLQARRTGRQRHTVDQRAFLVFQLAQVLGWTPQSLFELSKQQWGTLVDEIEAFPGLQRRRTYHIAYERRYRNQALDALVIHRDRVPARPESPSFQIVCCIDDREESFRRHIEEIDPDCETFGAAGFYGVAMKYRGAAEAHFHPLCPGMITPRHYVQEDVVYTFEESHRRRAETRRALGTASHRVHTGSRTIAGGVVMALFGSLASFPIVARILFPRLTARFRRLAGRFVQPPPVTTLHLERIAPEPGPSAEQLGYTIDEMVDIVRGQLRSIGLTERFARLIVVTGHGSSSVNNPHESAYNCGACSGGRGGPNARAFAQMANHPDVRERLAERGLSIPRQTVFLGAYHNTCDDSVTWFDLERLPASHRADFERTRGIIDTARERNAHERCRRFESADLTLTPEVALRHVEARAEDLSQARPEYNHATNALCHVGRRDRIRDLFLDRRAFLTSYDPHQDDSEHSILLGILQAAIPVCAGISLEYYFSCVDPAGWGCGSKLPHNIVSLLGVMEGATSDLRPGLSEQMIEIHEPMRILFVIEATAETMLSLMDRDETIGRLCRNRWVQLATQDPDSGEIQVYEEGRFVPYQPQSTDLPEVASSIDWYRGWRGHLGFASIRSARRDGEERTTGGAA